MKSVLIILLCALSVIAAQSDEQPLATAPIGKIRGSILTSRLGRKIYSFRGVRYAESPTGPRRFQPPVPAQNWHDVFDASQEGPSCPQPTAQLQSEDCLRLNVYTTKLPKKGENVSRPVMVFIHPGGFYSFSGQSSIFGPQYIMDKDIVLVTINYRLGALGFVSTGDSAAPGNLGLKDQVAALRWVQKNIAAFGGNPNAVTLCGDSAGSFSIILHMVSPMSTNLFHRAIGMSASPFTADVYFGVVQNGQKELAEKQARLVGCPTDSTDAMMRCFATTPTENFTNTLGSMFEWYQTPILLWKPTVEPPVPGLERFLTGHPYDLIKQRRYKQVPTILGVTEHEFGGVIGLYEQAAKMNGTSYQELNNEWNRLAPIVFQYPGNSPRSDYISQELRRFYFQDQPIGSSTYKGLANIYADSIIIFPMWTLAKLLAATSCQPVYFYKFTFEGRYSFYKWNETSTYGASHQDDLMYIFYMKDIFPYFESDAPEIPMVEVSTSMWSNFVATGEPIPRNDNKFRGVTWDTFVPAETNFLDINLRPTMKNKFFPERMRVWERLFPLPKGGRPHNVKNSNRNF